MRIALLGGSFNPPHVGHAMAACYVRSTQRVDRVWLVPTFVHPFGKKAVAFEHRVKMCALLAAEASGWLEVSAVERDLAGDGRTVDLLEHLAARHPEHQWVLVIGSDILKDLPHWKDFDRIQALAEVLVLHRAGYSAPEAVGPPLAEVSSTQIRDLFERGESPGALVPSSVLDYARANGLYL